MPIHYPHSLAATLLALAAALPAQRTQTDTPVAESAELRAALARYPHRLLFETDRDGDWELYTCRADGSDLQNLTRTPEVDETGGKVSPDGQWIAYCADTATGDDGGGDGVPGRRRDIWLMRVDGKDRMRLGEHARDPFWSADNTELGFLPDEFAAFSIVTHATRGLRVFSFVTGETREHPGTDVSHLFCPGFSADGRWIVSSVHGGLGKAHAIVALAADGSAVHDLQLYGCRPDLAADGRALCWGNGEYAIQRGTLQFDDGAPRVVDGGPIVHNAVRRGDLVYHADWSPDGRYVAYTAGPRDGRRRLGSNRTPETCGIEAPGWNLWVADAAGTNVRVQITHDGHSNKEPDWIRVADAEADAPTDEEGGR